MKRDRVESNGPYADLSGNDALCIIKPDAPYWPVVLATLDRHERRRASLPTISTLIAPIDLAIYAWRRWAKSTDRPIQVLGNESVDQLITAWVSRVFVDRNLAADAETWLARMASLPVAEIRHRLDGKTVHEIDVLFSLPQLQDRRDSGLRFSRWILDCRALGHAITPEAYREWILSQKPDEADHDAMQVRVLMKLVPITATPGTVIVFSTHEPPDPSGQYADWECAIARIFKTVTLCPGWTLGIAFSPQLWTLFQEMIPESRAKAAILENAILLESYSEETIQQLAAARLGDTAPKLAPIIRQIAKEGADSEFVERLIEAAAESDGDNPEGLARSKQERFLFDLLERSRDLCGLFQLNVKPGFVFGGRSAEIDLACPSLKIAVEVDGIHHFADRADYRRDRRKDFVLQQHGYMVLRFLAEDVVPQMDLIRQTIREAVAHRRNASTL